MDQDVSTDVEDNDKWQPVHAAACWGHVRPKYIYMLTILVESKVSSKFILSLQLEVLELLVQNGADLNPKNKHDETPAGKNAFDKRDFV